MRNNRVPSGWSRHRIDAAPLDVSPVRNNGGISLIPRRRAPSRNVRVTVDMSSEPTAVVLTNVLTKNAGPNWCVAIGATIAFAGGLDVCYGLTSALTTPPATSRGVAAAHSG